MLALLSGEHNKPNVFMTTALNWMKIWKDELISRGWA